MPQYFEKVRDSLAGVRQQLDGIAGATDSAHAGVDRLISGLQSVINPEQDQTTALERSLNHIAKLVGETSTLYKADAALKYARSNSQLTQTYYDQWKTVSKLGSSISQYSSRITELQNIQAGLSQDDFDSWLRIEQAVELIRKQQEKATDELEQAKVVLTSIDSESLNIALNGQMILDNWENVGNEFSKFRQSFPTKLFTSAIMYSSRLNEDLIQANSSLAIRNRLYADSVSSATRLGLSLSSVSTVQAALVGRGYDLVKSDHSRLDTVLKLGVALGADANVSAELSAISDSISSNFDDVANHVAKIVDNTAVAADEAERYATALSKSALLSNQAGNQLGVTTELVSRVEGLLKQHGLDSGKFIQLVQRANTIEGLGVSLMHGGGIMSMLQNPQDMANFITGLVQRAQTFGSGPGGAMARTTYAESLGIDPELLADMFRNSQQYLDISANLLKSQSNGNELQKRWVEQIGAAQKSVSQLWESLKNLSHYGLVPVVNLVTRLSTILSSWFNGFSSFLSGKFLDEMQDGPAKTFSRYIQRVINLGFKIGFPVTIIALLSRSVASLVRHSYELVESLLRLSGAMQTAARSTGAGTVAGGTSYRGTSRGLIIGGTGAIMASQLVNEAVQQSEASDQTKKLVDSSATWIDISIAFVSIFHKWTRNMITKAGSLIKRMLPRIATGAAAGEVAGEGGMLARMLPMLGRVGVWGAIAALVSMPVLSFLHGYAANKTRNDLLLDRAPTMSERINNGLLWESDRKENRQINLNRQLRPVKEQLTIYTSREHDEAVVLAFNRGWEDYTKFIMDEQRKMLILVDGISHINDAQVKEIIKRVNAQASIDKLAGFKLLEKYTQRDVVRAIRQGTGRLTKPQSTNQLEAANNNAYGTYEDIGNGRSISKPSYFIPGGQAQTKALLNSYESTRLNPNPKQNSPEPELHTRIKPISTRTILPPPQPNGKTEDDRVTAAISSMNTAVVNAINRLHRLESDHWQADQSNSLDRDVTKTLITGSFA